MGRYHFELDYSEDSLRWLKIFEDFYNKYSSKHQEQDLVRLQNEIILAQDSAMAYFFTVEFGYQPYKMRKVILDNKIAKYAYLFAQNIKNADIKALQNIVITSKKVKYICKFACFVKGADYKPLEAIVLKSKNVKYAHMLLKHVKNANINKLKKIIIASGKPRYLFELAKHLTNPKEIAMIEDLIIKSGSFTYMRIFADKIKLANLDKIERAVLASDNIKEIKKFVGYVRKSKMKPFLIVS